MFRNRNFDENTIIEKPVLYQSIIGTYGNSPAAKVLCSIMYDEKVKNNCDYFPLVGRLLSYYFTKMKEISQSNLKKSSKAYFFKLLFKDFSIQTKELKNESLISHLNTVIATVYKKYIHEL